MPDPLPKLRLDKWLWHARFFKTRSLAARQVAGGHVRVNGEKASKPARTIGPGDVLTFAQGKQIRVVEVVCLGERRGPAAEARTLYLDRTERRNDPPDNPRFEGKGRPDKKARRALELSRQKGIP